MIQLVLRVWYIIICIIEKAQSLLLPEVQKWTEGYCTSFTEYFHVCKSTRDWAIGDWKSLCLAVCLSVCPEVVWLSHLESVSWFVLYPPRGLQAFPAPKAPVGLQDWFTSPCLSLIDFDLKVLNDLTSTFSRGLAAAFLFVLQCTFPFIGFTYASKVLSSTTYPLCFPFPLLQSYSIYVRTSISLSVKLKIHVFFFFILATSLFVCSAK